MTYMVAGISDILSLGHTRHSRVASMFSLLWCFAIQLKLFSNFVRYLIFQPYGTSLASMSNHQSFLIYRYLWLSKVNLPYCQYIYSYYLSTTNGHMPTTDIDTGIIMISNWKSNHSVHAQVMTLPYHEDKTRLHTDILHEKMNHVKKIWYSIQ